MQNCKSTIDIVKIIAEADQLINEIAAFLEDVENTYQISKHERSARMLK